MYNSHDEFLNIDTPENVAFGYEVAGIGSRFIAALVDTILIIILQLVVNVAVLFLGRLLLDLLDTQLDGANDALFAWLVAGFGLLAFALLWGYYIGFELFWNGQSPGKWMMDLRVLRTDGSPISLVEALIRNLVRLVDFMPAFYGVGVVTMFINTRARRLGDLAANTLVVYDQTAITLDSLDKPAELPGANGPVSDETRALPLERLRDKDIHLVEDFMRRRLHLANTSDLTMRLVHMLHRRMDLPPQNMSVIEGDHFLDEVVRAYRQRAMTDESNATPKANSDPASPSFLDLDG